MSKVIKSLGVLVWFCLALTLSIRVEAYTLSDGEVLTDPTRPATLKAVKSAPVKNVKPRRNYTLNYIVSSGSVKRAMINGKKVFEGDYISGAKVVEIGSSSVSLLVDGKVKLLRLNKVHGIKRN